jgi:hypothetical protein
MSWKIAPQNLNLKNNNTFFSICSTAEQLLNNSEWLLPLPDKVISDGKWRGVREQREARKQDRDEGFGESPAPLGAVPSLAVSGHCSVDAPMLPQRFLNKSRVVGGGKFTLTQGSTRRVVVGPAEAINDSAR